MADGSRLADGRAGTKLRLAFVAGVWLAVTAAAALVPGCYGRNCDPSVETFGNDPGEGHFVTPTVWESNPVEGPWLRLPGSRTWVFQVPGLMGRRFKWAEPYLSGSEAPLDAGANFTVGSGNSAVMVPFADGSFFIQNTTCADYFLRVQVETYPAEDAGADGGTDAGPSDAAARD